MTPRDFEVLVCDYYANNGYTTELTPSSNDWGIDVLLILIISLRWLNPIF